MAHLNRAVISLALICVIVSRAPSADGALDTITQIKASEITARLRWAKNEEFISGAFDRTSLRSKYPIIAIQGVFGIKGVLGSQYSYQKIELQLELYFLI